MPTMRHNSISLKRELFIHRIVNEVHCISNILKHAPEGHKQVAVLETFQEAKRNETAEKVR